MPIISWTALQKENFYPLKKKIIKENNLAFLYDESGTSVKDDCLTPDKFYKDLSTISPTFDLYLCMNISSLVENCQNKPKVIGINNCRLKTNRTILSNTDLQDYTYEETPTAASRGGS